MEKDLVKRLIEKYGYNEPIFTEEVLSSWKEYSRTRVFQLLKEYTARGQLSKADRNIYYIPTKTFLGTSSILSTRKIIEKRFINSNGEICGYYGGISLLNVLCLTQQVPNTLEVVTTKESMRLRRIRVGNMNVILKKARTEINSQNVAALQLLDAFNEMGRPLDEDEVCSLRRFISRSNVKEGDVFRYAQYFPAKAVKNLIITGVKNVFA